MKNSLYSVSDFGIFGLKIKNKNFSPLDLYPLINLFVEDEDVIIDQSEGLLRVCILHKNQPIFILNPSKDFFENSEIILREEYTDKISMKLRIHNFILKNIDKSQTIDGISYLTTPFLEKLSFYKLSNGNYTFLKLL